MKEKPILFSTNMVRAILLNKKTETRRIIKPQPKTDEDLSGVKERASQMIGCILWVKETFTEEGPCGYMYRADYLGGAVKSAVKWKSSLFMPKKASRIHILVKDVFIERLNDISPEDCLREGIDENLITGSESPVSKFKDLWESINGSCSWDENPYVKVIKFEKIKSN